MSPCLPYNAFTCSYGKNMIKTNVIIKSSHAFLWIFGIPKEFWIEVSQNHQSYYPSANKWIWPVCWNFVYVMRAWAISRTTCLSNKYKSSARVEKQKIIVHKSGGEHTISISRTNINFAQKRLFGTWKLGKFDVLVNFIIQAWKINSFLSFSGER